MLRFRNHREEEQFCFDKLNIKVQNFAVAENGAVILVYDHRSYIDVIRNGQIVG